MRFLNQAQDDRGAGLGQAGEEGREGRAGEVQGVAAGQGLLREVALTSRSAAWAVASAMTPRA